jgi:phosphoglycolate phosphatase
MGNQASIFSGGTGSSPIKKLFLRTVVFDFDGTLVKLSIDFSLMRQAVLELLARYNISTEELKDLYVLEMIDAGKELIMQCFPGKGPDFYREAHERIVHIEMAAAQKSTLIDGTLTMLRELRRRRITTGVVTRNCLSSVRIAFPDIYEYCDAVVTRENTNLVKPNPEHLRRTLAKLNASPEFSAMVGDHPMDIKIGKEAGLQTIGVITGHSSFVDLENAGADLILNKAADLIDLLGEL